MGYISHAHKLEDFDVFLHGIIDRNLDLHFGWLWSYLLGLSKFMQNAQISFRLYDCMTV